MLQTALREGGATSPQRPPLHIKLRPEGVVGGGGGGGASAPDPFASGFGTGGFTAGEPSIGVGGVGFGGGGLGGQPPTGSSGATTSGGGSGGGGAVTSPSASGASSDSPDYDPDPYGESNPRFNSDGGYDSNPFYGPDPYNDSTPGYDSDGGYRVSSPESEPLQMGQLVAGPTPWDSDDGSSLQTGPLYAGKITPYAPSSDDDSTMFPPPPDPSGRSLDEMLAEGGLPSAVRPNVDAISGLGEELPDHGVTANAQGALFLDQAANNPLLAPIVTAIATLGLNGEVQVGGFTPDEVAALARRGGAYTQTFDDGSFRILFDPATVAAYEKGLGITPDLQGAFAHELGHVIDGQLQLGLDPYPLLNLRDKVDLIWTYSTSKCRERTQW